MTGTSSGPRSRRATLSIPQWAEHSGIADDGRSVAIARILLATGQGPQTVKLGQREGVSLQDHEAWARKTPWAKYLTTSAAAEREHRQRIMRRSK